MFEKKYTNDFHFLDNIKYMALMEEPDGTITYANKHFCNFFGVSQSEAIGRKLFDFLVQDDRAACDAQYMVSPENPHYRVEGRAILKDGTVSWLQFVGSGIFNNNGDLVQFQEVCIDISRWKEEIESEVRKMSKAHIQLTGSGSSPASRQDLNNHFKRQDLGNMALYTFDDIVTRNPKMENLIKQAKIIAQGNSSVLIEGESGTGKELMAQSIHNASKRANAPFVAINCGAIAPELLQSELFGYVEGAFTGARKEGKTGKFELADNGTLFLDEIGEMPLSQQVSLLRVLETRTVTRMGDHQVIPVNIRIICATNKNLFKEVCEGNFRNDLYFRLNVINLRIPPLRERKEDIYPLIQMLLNDYEPEIKEKFHLTQQQMQLLYQSNWPGNIRELRNIVERLVYMPDYDLNHLMQNEVYMKNDDQPPESILQISPEDKDIADKAIIENALKKYNGNVTLASRELGISRNTFYKKVSKYNITIERK